MARHHRLRVEHRQPGLLRGDARRARLRAYAAPLAARRSTGNHPRPCDEGRGARKARERASRARADMGRDAPRGIRRDERCRRLSPLVRLAGVAPRAPGTRTYAHRAVTRPTLITIIGKSARDPNDPVPEKALRMAEEVGSLIAERKGIVVTGGLSGVMQAVSGGAKSAGGLVIGILPGFDKGDANEFVDIAITTGMGWMRNTLTVRAADAVIMISGGIGTLNELTVAYELKPTVILEGSGGWSDRIRETAYQGKHLDESGSATLYFATTPSEAVELAFSLAARRHGDSRVAGREFKS